VQGRKNMSGVRTMGAQNEPVLHQAVPGRGESESFTLFEAKSGGFVSVRVRTLFESENGPRTGDARRLAQS